MNFIFLQFMEVWMQWVPRKVNVTPYECNGSHAKLMWRPLGVTYFGLDTLRSYFDEPQKDEIYFLNNYLMNLLYKINQQNSLNECDIIEFALKVFWKFTNSWMLTVHNCVIYFMSKYRKVY